MNNITNSALNYLAMREHSRYELKEKLLKKSFDEREIEDVLEALVKRGLQSDTRFIEVFVRSYVSKGKGSRVIEQKLKQKGIVDVYFDDIDFVEVAHRARVKKFGEAVPKNIQEKSKQIRFLISRGFLFEHINEALSDTD